jgi:uncharacterized Zn-binding protein involved in type VI secretion
MSAPAAKQGDRIVGIDTHILMVASPGGPVPTPTPMPFSGSLSGALSPDVMIDNEPAATKGSTAHNAPEHVPAVGPFQKQPANKATIQAGSSTVFVDGKPLARATDPALTCNDPADAPNGSVICTSTVLVGG